MLGVGENRTRAGANHWCKIACELGRTNDWQKDRQDSVLRRSKLEPDEAKLVGDVEKYGCHVIQVRKEGGFPGWSYTIGLSEVLGAPS